MVAVVMETEMGIIEMAVDTVRAPITAANFLKYVEGKFYDGGKFHRAVTMDNQPNDTVKIEVIQCDINRERQKESYPAIVLERTSVTGLKHKNGTLSMARNGPDTATGSFSIVINEQPEMDFGGKRNKDGQGFAAFGEVIKGMEVVKKIQAAPKEGQSMKPPVKIISVKRK
jgi:peptidyl-prolyl cis-trans isomerase A (cyclophilin A)